MAKCVIVSGTRVCEDSFKTYRVNGSKVSKPFGTLSKSEVAELRPIISAIRDLGVDPAQSKLATALLQAVLATRWNSTKGDNSVDIEQTVKLLLVDEVGTLNGMFTVVAY